MYSQSNFFYGGINTDDEDRFLPKGDYRDALYSRNYGINTSDEGALQSMTGNALKPNPNLPLGINVIIGSCEDPEGKGSSETGNLILFVYNDLGNHSIWRYNVQGGTYTKILQSSLLNFQLDHKITHAAVVDGKLYWTDNYFESYEKDPTTSILGFNPPRKLNIEKAILYTNGDYTNGYDGVNFETLDWIKYPPRFSPTAAYVTDTTRSTNYLKDKLFQFRYQYVYDDNEESAWSPISELALPTQNEYITSTTNIDPSVDNCIQVTINSGSAIVKLVRLAFRIGNTGEFFMYGEYDPKVLEWPINTDEIINFYNEVAGVPISNSERNYDLVPQVAKTVEYLPSNEFAIGNGVEGYDKPVVRSSDFAISIDRFAIDNTAFTNPLADFINCKDSSGNRVQIISLNNAKGGTFVKYRFEPGDVIVLQLKDLSNYLSNTVAPDPVVYFTVPEIDGAIHQTDQDKIKYLSFLIGQELTVLFGIVTDLIPAGTITIDSTIDWWTLKIGDSSWVTEQKTWFNQTQAQINDSSSAYYTQKINVLRDNHSTRTFKTGATHEFALQYYDRANRDGTVVQIPVGSVYNPFYTDLTDAQLNGPLGLTRKPYFTQMSLTIANSFLPPDWATHYQVVYKPSTNIANFQQRSVKRITYNPDTTINLILDDYYKTNVLGASINQTPSKGDFVRFVRQRAGFERELSPVTEFSFNTTQSLTLFDPGTGNYTGYLDLTSFITAGYNPSGAMSGGVFTAPTTGYYYFKPIVKALATSISTITSAVLSVKISVNGGPQQYVAGNGTLAVDGQIDFPQINGQTTVYLNATDTVEFIMEFVVLSYGITPPSTATLEIQSSDFTISSLDVDYDTYKYAPAYTTSDSVGHKELNVLKYDPAGGPNGEEMVTVDYFDSSILGMYLTYTGTNNNRTLASGGFQIEIYTPKKDTENDPWYETGIEFPILNANKANRAHGGDTNQVPGITDAIVTLDCGDVYIRRRVMATGYKYDGDYPDVSDAEDNSAIWFCEDPHYSDFYISNWNNKGRLAIYSPFAKRQRLKATIYHTKQLLDETQVNGLSRVEFQDQIQLREEQGEINKLIQLGDVLKAFQDRKVTSVYIQKTFALNGDGTNNVIVSDRTFGAVRPHDDDYGTIHPGSVSRVENDVYFYDYYNSAFVVVNQGGMFNICETDKKFSKGVRDLTSRVNSAYGGYKNANIWSHINRNNNEYTFYVTKPVQGNLPGLSHWPIRQFVDNGGISSDNLLFDGDVTGIFTPGFQFFVDNSPNAQNNGTYTVINSVFSVDTTTVAVSNQVVNEVPKDYTVYANWYGNFDEISGEALCYSYERQRWITRYNAGAIFATQFGAKAYSTGGPNVMDLGELFEENIGAELTFWGSTRQQIIDFVFNDQPLITKRFFTHLQQSNRPFRADVVAPITVRDLLGNYTSETMETYILPANLKQQEGYFVSRYFRDTTDKKYPTPEMARMNGRELRGYVLRHRLSYLGATKSILMSVGVNYVPSEPLIQ